MENTILEKMHRYSETLWEVIILNFMLVFLSLAGGLIFGWAPGFVAVLTVIKEKVIQKKESKNLLEMIKKTWKIYRKEFKRANIIGNLILIWTIVLTINIINFQEGTELYSKFFYLLSTALRLSIVLLSLVILPVYVYYKMEIKQYFYKSISLIILNPLLILSLVIWCWLNSKLIEIFPKIGFFVGGYLFLLGIMLINYQFFKKNHREQNENGDI